MRDSSLTEGAAKPSSCRDKPTLPCTPNLSCKAPALQVGPALSILLSAHAAKAVRLPALQVGSALSMEEAQRRVRLQRASLGTAKSVAWPSTITEEDRLSMTGSSVEGRSSDASSNVSLGDGGERLCRSHQLGPAKLPPGGCPGMSSKVCCCCHIGPPDGPANVS